MKSKMGRKIWAALLCQCVMFSMFTMNVFAVVAADNPAGTTIASIASGDSMDTNNGIIQTNDGAISNINNGTIEINNGTIAANTGTVDDNRGTVNNNVYNNGKHGTIGINNGSVGTNAGGCTITDNRGTVTSNSGIIVNNYNTVTDNNERLTNNFGTVNSNTTIGGIENNYGGTIVNNPFTNGITHDFRKVIITGTNADKLDVTGLTTVNNSQWVELDSNGKGSVTITPQAGYIFASVPIAGTNNVAAAGNG